MFLIELFLERTGESFALLLRKETETVQRRVLEVWKLPFLELAFH